MGNYVVPAAITWTVTGDKGTPDLRMEFAVRDGRPECTGFHVVASPQGRPVRTSDLAGLNVDVLVRDVFMEFADVVTEEDPLSAETRPADEREMWQRRKVVEDAQATGRGPSLEELQQVVAVYREHPKAPMQAVELVLGYSRRTAYRRVQQARERGLFEEQQDQASDDDQHQPTQDEIRDMLRQRGHGVPGDASDESEA
ncbi:hypothetical protein [Amycolatopsis aidingensis]|uniref:hypothetical protein n=1 Tax=Amycolatopsis aidingensis TaxID=2842453 RepID=UPI001C0CFB99|nr:hypothetical protein [Amycolatopsis aidingensis]